MFSVSSQLIGDKNQNRSVNSWRKKPPDSPGDQDLQSWQRERQQYVDDFWKASEAKSNGTERLLVSETFDDSVDIVPEVVQPDTPQDKELDDESYEVEGRVRPLIEEGERLMICYVTS